MREKRSEKKNKTLILFAIAFALFVILISNISAATYYWVGSSNGRWANASSWASSSGGAGGAGIPGSADDVIFD